MAFKPVKLPKTAINRKLEKSLKRLKAMTLLERLELELQAKLITPEEFEEIKGRLSPDQLAAR